PLSHPDVVTERWRSAEMIVILPTDHPWADRREITVDEFLTLDMIGGESGSGTGTLLRDMLGDRAGELQTRANVGSTEAVKQAVMSGLGASIILAEAVTHEINTGSLVGICIEGMAMKKTFFTARLKTVSDDEIATKLSRFLTG
ncbi:MAG: LysR substrate-binding domain-containing protein, partial [Pseudomonadota bacterium]